MRVASPFLTVDFQLSKWGLALSFASTCAQRFKRVFGIDVKNCARYGGAMCIIACIEDPVVIKVILAHLADKARPAWTPVARLPQMTVRLATWRHGDLVYNFQLANNGHPSHA